MQSVKEDILKDKVYVFTPTGDVMELPFGSSTLDFAYHIHTEVGRKSTGAKVNGKIVPLNYKLKTGDIIEMITSSNSFGPSRDWLNYVSTSKARNKIKQFFKTQDKGENIVKGRELLENQLIELDFSPKSILTKPSIKALAERMNFQHEDDLLAAIGYGELRALSIANRLTEDERKKRDQEKKIEDLESVELKNKKEPTRMTIKHQGGVLVEGADNLLLRLSRCCNPVPGDEIVGYVTRGRGVSVHRTDCPNVQNLDEDEVDNRLVHVEWEDTGNSKNEYNAELQITGYDRAGFLNEILQVINTQTKNLVNVNGRVNRDKMAVIQVTIGIKNLNELELIVDKIKSIPEVYHVKRITT